MSYSELGNCENKKPYKGPKIILPVFDDRYIQLLNDLNLISGQIPRKESKPLLTSSPENYRLIERMSQITKKLRHILKDPTYTPRI